MFEMFESAMVGEEVVMERVEFSAADELTKQGGPEGISIGVIWRVAEAQSGVV
jgi:hypothetical protein